MTAQDKRARKKQHRDEIRAARDAELKRRRNIRLLVLVGLLVVLVGGAIAFSGEEQGEPAATDEPAEQAEAACGAEAPPEANPQQYDSPPPDVTEEGVDYSATIHTSCGDLVIDLLEEQAPQAVNNFVFLAQEGFYDGLIWHRVESNAVIQTGDPNGQNGVPPDGPGYTIPDELPERSRDYVYGVVGMANPGQPDSSGSQFFIVTKKNRPAGYQPFYSIFGRVVAGETDATEEEIGCKSPGEPGIPTLDAIGCQPTDQGASDPAEAVKPIVPIYIESIEIHED